MDHPLVVGILYPFHGAEDDYPRMAAKVAPPLVAHVTHTTIDKDAHEVEALLETGSQQRLVEGATRLQQEAPTLASAMWACTSGSFVYGLEGARQQVEPLAAMLGVPVSSTSLAFLEAARAVGARTVSIAATYPDDVATLFAQLLIDGGFDVVNLESEGILAALDVGELDRGDVADLVTSANHPDADVVLVPDTALHTEAWIDELEALIGKPVLTANQVTMWQALRLAGIEQPRAQRLGRLFAQEP